MHGSFEKDVFLHFLIICNRKYFFPSIFCWCFNILVFPRSDLSFPFPRINLRLYNLEFDWFLIFHWIQFNFIFENHPYIIYQSFIIFISFSFEIVSYLLNIVCIILLAKTFQIDARSIFPKLEFITAAMETAHNLARRLIEEIHLKVTVFSLAVDESFIHWCYFLFGTVHTDELGDKGESLLLFAASDGRIEFEDVNLVDVGLNGSFLTFDVDLSGKVFVIKCS